MKFVFGAALRTFLCAVLLLGSAAFASAQEQAGQQSAPAADNTKVNERDKNQNEPTADQQKDNPRGCRSWQRGGAESPEL